MCGKGYPLWGLPDRALGLRGKGSAPSGKRLVSTKVDLKCRLVTRTGPCVRVGRGRRTVPGRCVANARE